uniref:Uncharacterized protein n=1 Tax=Apteryx owenii TaxID=8824 RepID=A0A8B9Q425_APTOW
MPVGYLQLSWAQAYHVRALSALGGVGGEAVMFGSRSTRVSAGLPFPLPCSFLAPSSLLAYLKSTSQILNLYNDLHMQQVRICPLRYIIDKKVLEK